MNKQSLKNIKNTLDKEVLLRNSAFEINEKKPDPLLIAKNQKCEYAILICALFSWGNAKNIVNFLKTLPFNVLDGNIKDIKNSIKTQKYRIHSTKDVQEIFISMHKLKQQKSLKKIFLNGYKKNHNVIEGIHTCIEQIYNTNDYRTQGYKHLIGPLNPKKSNSPLKRWNMFLRWMVRDDNVDLGLWSKDIDSKDLIIPLDTHVFNVSKKIGLLKSRTKSHTLKDAMSITNVLKEFDKDDPIKYDFAIYRLGQEKKYKINLEN